MKKFKEPKIEATVGGTFTDAHRRSVDLWVNGTKLRYEVVTTIVVIGDRIIVNTTMSLV